MSKLSFGRLEISFSRWPGQTGPWGCKLGWFNGGPLGRFGGGWKYKLGVCVGGSGVLFDLLFGSIYISWGRKSV